MGTPSILKKGDFMQRALVFPQKISFTETGMDFHGRMLDEKNWKQLILFLSKI